MKTSARERRLVERLVGIMNGGAQSGQHPALCRCRGHQPYWRVARKLARMKLPAADARAEQERQS